MTEGLENKYISVLSAFETKQIVSLFGKKKYSKILSLLPAIVI